MFPLRPRLNRQIDSKQAYPNFLEAHGRTISFQIESDSHDNPKHPPHDARFKG